MDTVITISIGLWNRIALRSFLRADPWGDPPGDEKSAPIGPSDERFGAPVTGKTEGPNIINIKDFAFDPEALIIQAGTIVTWTNRDSAAHNVSSDNFVSPDIAQDESYSFRFESPGIYDYYCEIHPDMKGRIIVKE
jgi:plastocyanin